MVFLIVEYINTANLNPARTDPTLQRCNNSHWVHTKCALKWSFVIVINGCSA